MSDAPPPITIRPAIISDARTMAKLFVISWQWTYRGLLPDDFLAEMSSTIDWRTEEYRVELSPRVSLYRHYRHWVVEQTKRVIGVAITRTSQDDDAVPSLSDNPATFPATGEVYAIYLQPQMVGKGIGRKLFAHAVTDLQQRGYDQATLWVLESNALARRFYEAAGWTFDGTQRAKREGKAVFHQIRYRKVLRQTRPSLFG